MFSSRNFRFALTLLFSFSASQLFSVSEASPRAERPLLDGWRTVMSEDPSAEVDDFFAEDFDDSAWKTVSIPHNWDGYEGFRQVKHGPCHGSAWYRREFSVQPEDKGRAIFLYFEGVGSYASIWVNGQLVDHHAGGLTTFTLNVTRFVDFDGPNTLAIRADHPSGIRDLPWVCGGCELAYGFSEGTQPFGISRPVTLVVTDSLRITPFGVFAWNDHHISAERATVNLHTEVQNHSDRRRDFTIRQRLFDADGALVAETTGQTFARSGATIRLDQQWPDLAHPRLWHPDHPHLYNVVTDVLEGDRLVDQLETRFGIRWFDWPDLNGEPGQPLRINGKPFFINGVADYEHNLGQSHAFTDEQVDARVGQILAAGFNSFRDAHHPHNLRFNEHWDREGVLWWTQMGAHIWFDNANFRATYKERLRNWVIERRNSPSLFIYTIQNESKIPAWFAAECAELIRQLDPTARIQRPVVTCNGGGGTDWDVPQNWSGTYGGDPYNYANELIQQRLVGEYGAWRSLGYHHEGGFFNEAPLTEGRMAGLLEIKLGLAETVRDSVVGHYMWPFTTHQNPGRNVGGRGEQTRDGVRALDQIGPANNKGLISIWGEPLDAFYMYRSNYADPATDPMVYIVSHTWPDRWVTPGVKDDIRIYSNCDEVELFNDFGGRSLGVRKRGAKGSHFRWDGVEIQTNLLYAEGRVDGQVVARDWINLHHLPPAPGLAALKAALGPDRPLGDAPVNRPHLYRINAGGPEVVDTQGRRWAADRVFSEGDAYGSNSWAERFPNLDPRFGSKRAITDAVLGTTDDALYQSYRYGRDELSFTFTVPPGHYVIELHFIEPWYGVDGGDPTGWRRFDVAVNGQTLIEDLDLFATAGQRTAYLRVVEAEAVDGQLVVHFPRVLAGQAVISALAVAHLDDPRARPVVDAPQPLLVEATDGTASLPVRSWLDTGVRLSSNDSTTLVDLSWELRETTWIEQPSTRPGAARGLAATTTAPANLYLALSPAKVAAFEEQFDWESTPFTLATSDAPETAFPIFRYRAEAGERLSLPPAAARALSPFYLLAEERRPPPPAAALYDFTVSGSQSPAEWTAIGNLRAGQPLYGDGGPAIARFHNRLSDCDWIRAPRADAANPNLHASFRVEDHTEIYLALDARHESIPGWMVEQDWIPAFDYTLLTTEDGAPGYKMWRKRYLPGETVHLGPNAELPDGSPARMYAAIARAVRAAFTLETELQDNAAGLVASDLPGYLGDGYVDLAGLSGDMFALGFEVGVGDRYGLNIRYQSRSAETIGFDVVIRNASDGAVVCRDHYEFPPTAPGEWSILRKRTCNSTNAGYYWVELHGPDLQNLMIDSMEVE